MVLGNTRILQLIKNGLVDNLAQVYEDVNPASLDIRVGNQMMLLSSEGSEYAQYDQVGNRFITKSIKRNTKIHPGECALIDTMRYYKFPNDVGGQIRMKSSRGREFYELMDAGWVDPGYEGRLTLELINHSKVSLPVFPGLKIAQIIFHQVDGCTKPYAGKYKGDVLVSPSKDVLEF